MSGASDGFLEQLGITSRETGVMAATGARKVLIAGAKEALTKLTDWSLGYTVLTGLIAHGQAMHEGALVVIEANNAPATFTLLRAYAENAAAVLWVKDHPDEIPTRWVGTGGYPVKVGAMTNAASKRFGNFAPLYATLSGLAHPTAKSVIQSHRVKPSEGETDETTRTLAWQSAPSFKREEDVMIACGWLVELATAHAHLFNELAEVIIGDPVGT